MPFVLFSYCFNLLAMGIYYFNKNSCLDSTHTVMQTWETFVASFFLWSLLSCDCGVSALVGSAGRGNESLVDWTRCEVSPGLLASPLCPCGGRSPRLPPLPPLLPPPAFSALSSEGFGSPSIVPAGLGPQRRGVRVRRSKLGPSRFWFLYHFQTQMKGIVLFIAL